jgi:tetratricopeptide (TPR) repeat protein
MGKASNGKIKDTQPPNTLPGIEQGMLSKAGFHILVIIILGFLIYSNTFHAQFVFDDLAYIVENPAIKDFYYFSEPSRVLDLPTVHLTFRYGFMTRIAGYFTFALNYHIHGLDVTGYHVFNLLVHIINALLIYFLVRLIFKTPFFSNQKSDYKPTTWLSNDLFAFFSALIFICHPIQTEAVTYITQRFACLATLFFLLSLLTYIQSRLSNTKTGRYALYSTSLITAIIAMKTKEISFTLPVIITLFEFLFFNGKYRKRIFLLIPFALTLLIIPTAILRAYGSFTLSDMDHSMQTLAADPGLSRWDYLLTQFSVIVTYIRLLILPVNLNLDYDYPVYHTFWDPSVFSPFIFLLLLFSLGIFFLYRSKNTHREGRQTYRLISFGILWFFVTLAVESSVIPIRDIIFEHRLYLPSVGFILSVMTAVSMITREVENRMTVRALTTAIFLLVSIFAGATYARNFVWQNEITLWEDVVKKSPFKDRPHYNLGVAYVKEGRAEEAIKEYLAAIKIKPDFAEAHYNLGVAYDKEGRTEEAMKEYITATKIKPDYAEAHSNLGILFKQTGRLEDSIREFQFAITLQPGNADLHYNLGQIYYQHGRLEEAIQEFKATLRLNPEDTDARVSLEAAMKLKSKNVLDY